MRIDVYTRCILSGIALYLVWLWVVLTPWGTPVSAQTNVQDVRIVNIRQPEVRTTKLLDGSIRQEWVGGWDNLPTD